MEGLWIGISGWLHDTLGISPALAERLAWTVTTWVLYALLRLLATSVLDNRVADVSKRYIINKSINYLLGFALILATLIVWFGNVTGWAAYLGILSAGLAIALQDPVTNLAGWIFISIRKPFAVGDRIQIGEHRGDVIDMRLFQFTMVEIGNWVSADQSTGRIIHIPNGWVFKSSTANYTQGFNFIWNELPITVTFESNWEAAKEILAEVATRHSHPGEPGRPGAGSQGGPEVHDPLPAPHPHRVDLGGRQRGDPDRAVHIGAPEATIVRGSDLGGRAAGLRRPGRCGLCLPHHPLLPERHRGKVGGPSLRRCG